MPRDITHVILANEAANTIRNKEIFDNLGAFHMGCIACDSFLYTASPQLSSRLHGGYKDDTRAVVIEMMNELKKENDPAKASEKKAFIYGYLCHMAADTIFHPLIYSISGSHLKGSNRSISDMALSKACHRYAETWLDLHMMQDKHISFNNFRPFRKIITKITMRTRLDDFFTDCFQNALKAKKYTWGDNFDLQAQFHNGMTRQLFVDKITQNQTIAQMLRKLDKFLNGKLKTYTSGFYNFDKNIPKRLTAGSFIHPVTGETINKSIRDLEKDTIDYSVRYIKAADEYIRTGDLKAFKKVVPNFNLDTGTVNGSPADFINMVSIEELASMIENSRNIPESKINKLMPPRELTSADINNDLSKKKKRTNMGALPSLRRRSRIMQH